MVALQSPAMPRAPARKKPAARKPGLAAARTALLKAALAYPSAWEDHPWGETVVKVGKKVFVFLGVAGESLSLSLKLPTSSEAALATFRFTAPTGYGLDRGGWVTSTFAKGEDVPLPLLLEWLDESYRAVAPKAVVKTLAPR
jgi:predicted DNA-binding protein (MmcQ/YjbR family)